jgi:hypothetical protein
MTIMVMVLMVNENPEFANLGSPGIRRKIGEMVRFDGLLPLWAFGMIHGIV